MKIVVNGHKDSLNTGNMLMAIGLHEGLKKQNIHASLILLSDLPEIDSDRYKEKPAIEVIGRPWAKQKKGALRAVATALLYVFWVFTGQTAEFISGYRLKFPWNRLCRAYRSADLSVDISGDDLTTAYGLIAPLQVLYELFLAKLFGLKTVLLAQSMGPFDTVYMKIVGYLIRFLADVVTFRDSSSFYFWQQILSSDIKRDCSPDRPLADLIYLNKMPMATSASSPGPVIINLSNYVIESALQLEKDSIYPIGLHNNISDWVRLIEYFHLLTGRDLLLLPHTFRPGKGDDEYWLSKIFDKCPSELPVRKVSGPLAPNEIQKIVAESSFVVASRMHLALTAMKCGVPFLAIAYSHKYQQLVSPSFFEISPVIFLNEQCDGWPFSAIRERFELLWKDRQAYQNAIRLYAHKANLLAEENISFLTKIVKSSLRRC